MEINVMSPEETERLKELEAVIEKDLKGFLRVGMALKEIREKKLYRGKYTTWKDYLKREWDISKSHGNRYIDAFNVVENLKSVPDKMTPIGVILPKNEAQARALTPLAPDQQPDAWKTIVTITNGEVTALAATKVVQEILEAQLEEEKQGIQEKVNKEISIPDEFSTQFNGLIEVLDMYRKAGWKGFDRKKALEFLHAIEDYINS